MWHVQISHANANQSWSTRVPTHVVLWLHLLETLGSHVSVQDTIGLTMPAMTAWMDKELRGVQMATTVHSLLNT